MPVYHGFAYLDRISGRGKRAVVEALPYHAVLVRPRMEICRGNQILVIGGQDGARSKIKEARESTRLPVE